jgi:LPS sulfotransferase NodH
MLKSSNLTNILAFLKEINNPTWLLYDQTISSDFIEQLSETCPSVISVNIKELASKMANLTDETVIFCFSLESEKKLLEQLNKENKKQVKGIYLLLKDVLPRIISGTGIIGKYRQGSLKLEHIGKSWVPKKSNTYYAILCTPRSGSSFLCSLLKNNGFGLPKEHLRNEPSYLMKYRKEGGFELIDFFKTVAATGARNKYFGTKIISHFLEDVIERANNKERKFFSQNWLLRFKYLYLYRSDKVLQAISIYRAQQTSFWHKWSSEKKQKGDIEYNFQEIEDWYHQIIQQENQLVTRIKYLSEMKCEISMVNYEELVNNTEQVMLSTINPLLSRQGQKVVKIDAISKQIHGLTEEEIAEKFTKEYRERYSKEAIRNFQPSKNYS